MSYSGAGIALYRKMKSGQVKVLLGLRRINPGGGTWTFPGGGRERQDLSLLAAACREFKEEVGCDVLDSKYKLKGSVKTQIPFFFNWETFIMYSPNNILGGRKTVKRMKWYSEFTELRWFYTDELPKNLFFRVKPVVKEIAKWA